ncbi:MAG: hypothetical protein QW304_09665 [Thermoproteota archaeon]
MRLKTVTDPGDSRPVRVVSFLLEADSDPGEIGAMLRSVIMKARQTTGLTITFKIANEDAQEYIEKPKRWDIHFIRRAMVCLGPVSSLFDLLTFFIMLFIFKAS